MDLIDNALNKKINGSNIGDMEAFVRAYYASTPILAEIAKCESHFRQFNPDGSVLHGSSVWSDTGIMQINSFYQGAKAIDKNLDINTVTGNLAYGWYLYQKEGTTPWASSKKCWGKSDVAKNMIKDQDKEVAMR